MADPGVREGGLTVEYQTDPLDRFNRQGLMSFDQHALMRQVVHANRVAGIECPPERPEYLKSNPRSTITRCSHLLQPLIRITIVQSVSHFY